MFDSNDSGLFGQARMRRNMGVSTQGPVMETKRVGPNMPGGVNDPRSKQYNPNGSMNLEVGPGNGGGQTGGLDPVGPTGGLGGAWGKGEGGGFGGAGGPMPVGPKFGQGPVNPWDNDVEYQASLTTPNALGDMYDPSKSVRRVGSAEDYERWKSSRRPMDLDKFMNNPFGVTGGFDPVAPNSGLGGPWNPNPINPMKGVDWQTVNGNTFANVRPGFSDPYAASQAVKGVNQSNPNWVDTGNGNGYVDLHRRPGGRVQAPQPAPVPGNTGIVPPHLQGGGEGFRMPQSTLWQSDSANVAPREINPAMLNYLMTRNG